MGDYSKTTIVGNVGEDPKIVTFQDGGKVANISLATNEKWTDAKTGESKVRTEWHRVVIRDEKTIDNIGSLIKRGSLILVEGQNETRSYEKDGVKQYTTEVVVRPWRGEVRLLSDPRKPGGPA